MKFVNIFEKKEYGILLLLFVFNIITIYVFSNYLLDNISIKIYLISFAYFSFYMIYCFFLASSFDNKHLQFLQIKLARIKSVISLLGLFFTQSLFFFYMSIIYFYSIYHSQCPFLLTNFDYKIHAQKRCELYNINSTSIFPYQYICSFNAESNERNCSKVEKLIEGNEVIDEFVNEYYQIKNLYYCDLKKQPSNFTIVNYKICDEDLGNIGIFILFHIYLCIRCFFLILNYFRYIEPNIDHYEHLHTL